MAFTGGNGRTGDLMFVAVIKEAATGSRMRRCRQAARQWKANDESSYVELQEEGISGTPNSAT